MNEKTGGCHHACGAHGGVNAGDPCQARAYHGFNGLDDKVVEAVASFAKR